MMRSLLVIICAGLIITPDFKTDAVRSHAREAPSREFSMRPSASDFQTASEPREVGSGGREKAEERPSGFWIFDRPSQLGGMISDRGGFSDGYSVVPRGYSHLEFGYSFFHDKENKSRTKSHLLGEFSYRTGLWENFELRIKWSGYSFTESHFEGTSRWAGRNVMLTDHEDGGTDMSLGFKTQLVKQKHLIPNLSIIPAISLPTGTGSKSTGDVDPEMRLAWNYSLSEKWSVYGVGLATWLSDDEGRFFQSGASLATSYQFTPRLGGYLEYYGLYPNSRDSDAQHNIDFGPLILVNDNFQIDIRVGFGLNEEAPDFQAGIGFSYRF